MLSHYTDPARRAILLKSLAYAAFLLLNYAGSLVLLPSPILTVVRYAMFALIMVFAVIAATFSPRESWLRFFIFVGILTIPIVFFLMPAGWK